MHPDGFSRIAAVKLLHRRWSENEEIARRMRDEARLLGWLRHRNIVDVVDLTLVVLQVDEVLHHAQDVLAGQRGLLKRELEAQLGSQAFALASLFSTGLVYV